MARRSRPPQAPRAPSRLRILNRPAFELSLPKKTGSGSPIRFLNTVGMPKSLPLPDGWQDGAVPPLSEESAAEIIADLNQPRAVLAS